MKQQVFEIIVAVVLFFTVGLAAYVVRDALTGSDKFEITTLRMGQDETTPSATSAILFSNRDYSRAVRRAVLDRPVFALRLRGERPKNPEFNFNLLFFVKFATVEASKVVSGGKEACLKSAMLLTDTRNNEERFLHASRVCVPFTDAHEKNPTPTKDQMTARPKLAESHPKGGGAPSAQVPSTEDSGSTAVAWDGQLSEAARGAFQSALDQTFDEGLEAAEKALETQRMDEDALNLAFRAQVARGCPSEALISAMSDKKPAKSWDAMVSFVGDNLPEGKWLQKGGCVAERLKVAGILGNMGRTEAVPPLIDFAETFNGKRLTSENAVNLVTVLTPIAQLGGDEAVGYLFTLSTGHSEELIQEIAQKHLDEIAQREGATTKQQ